MQPRLSDEAKQSVGKNLTVEVDLEAEAEQFNKETENDQAAKQSELIEKQEKAKLFFLTDLANEQGISGLEKARRNLAIEQYKLKIKLDEFDRAYWFFRNKEVKRKGSFSAETINLVETVLNQYRALQAEIDVLAEVNIDNIEYLRDYEKTIQLASEAFETLGNDNQSIDKFKAFYDHIIKLPAKQPLSRLDLLFGIVFIIVAVAAILIPCVHYAAFFLTKAFSFILTHPLGGFDLFASATLGSVTGVAGSMACFTFFGERAKAHPRNSLEKLSESFNNKQIHTSFKPVKSSISDLLPKHKMAL